MLVHDDDDIPIDEIRKKNIRIFKAQGKHTKFHVFKTNISGKKLLDCTVCPVHDVNFDGSCRDIDPRVIHAAKASKTRALMTGVESGDYLDSEGNIVSVDNDFSRAAEVQGLVKQSLKIEMKKIEAEKIEAEPQYKNKEKIARAFITKFEREEREDDFHPPLV